MYKTLAFCLLFMAGDARGQYYYNDILGNAQAKENFLGFKKNAVKKVTVITTDPDGTPTEGFAILQQISASKNEMTTSTMSAVSPTSILTTNYHPNGSPLATHDSTEASVSVTAYDYDEAAGQLRTISSSSHEPGQPGVKFLEQRMYNFSGTQPTEMVRIKNGRDSLKVQFIKEEHGWVGEERWYQKSKLVETYYYYYDAAGRLTDIGRFNVSAKRILPEYTFEYDERGRMTGMNAFVSGTNQYRTWRYTYDGRGLKLREVIFNKYRQAEGKVIYNYE